MCEKLGFKLCWGCLLFYPFFYCIGVWPLVAAPRSPHPRHLTLTPSHPHTLTPSPALTLTPSPALVAAPKCADLSRASDDHGWPLMTTDDLTDAL